MMGYLAAPEHPLKVKYKRLQMKAEELLELERKKNPFYEQFVPEWKKITLDKGLNENSFKEIAGVLNIK
jgi:hypothetical protein